MMEMMGRVTSDIAACAAASGASPPAILRSTFSTTTMASSTTIPVASTSPNNVSELIENPSPSRIPSVPMIATGTETNGMTLARQLCRNTTTTSTTSTTASSSVWITASIELRTNTVGSYGTSYAMPSGKLFDNSAMVLRTAAESSSAFAPGNWNIGMPTAGLPPSMLRNAYVSGPSSMRATSRKYTTSPWS